MTRPRRILPAIVVAQFAGTSLWLVGNAIVPDLQVARGLDAGAVGWMATSVILGFIAGTLVSAGLGIADRFSPRALFLASAVVGAAANLGLLIAPSASAFFVFRFATGVCLAGIYPVGMKIAAGWYREGLGRAIGFLVGALVLGSALPHGLRQLGGGGPWQWVVIAASFIAVGGGLLLYFAVPDGPYLAARGRLRLDAIPRVFAVREFRASAFGYFGHMWELYTFWVFVPLLLAARGGGELAVSGWSFAVIAAGAVGCAGGGLVADRTGSAPVAAVQLGVSGACCLALPWLMAAPLPLFLAFLLVWGVSVVGDSPQFSTLNARTAPPELVGTGLTVANSIGFAITVASIEWAGWMSRRVDLAWIFPLVALGPALGLLSLRPLLGARAREAHRA